MFGAIAIEGGNHERATQTLEGFRHFLSEINSLHLSGLSSFPGTTDTGESKEAQSPKSQKIMAINGSPIIIP